MKFVFIGASTFGLRCLQALRYIDSVSLAGVVTAPRRFPISYRPEGVTNVLHADIEAYCCAHAIPVETIGEEAMKDERLLTQVCGWQPDAFLVAGWYHMIPRRWRECAPAYGLHASLLPDYSGGAPLVWAIINGERKTGITIFELAGGVDNGPILGQAETVIRDDDTIATLYRRIEDLGVGLVHEHVDQLARGCATFTRQEESRRRLVPQRSPEDGEIDWRWPAKRVYDFVRAQTRPYPGAFTSGRAGPIHIWAVAPAKPSALLTGSLEVRGGKAYVGCGEHTSVELISASSMGEDLNPDGLVSVWFADTNL